MARHSDRPVKTYSIGFDTGGSGGYYNELPYAKQISQLFKTEHREIIVKPDVARLLPKLLWHMDEPIADTAFITTYLVSEFARREVTVILSGVGGDELFGGYRRYLGEYYSQKYTRLPSWLRRRILKPLARRLPSDRHSPVLNLSRYARSFILASDEPFEERYRRYIQVFDQSQRKRLLGKTDDHGPDALTRAFEVCTQGDELTRLFQADLATQLPDDLLLLTDKMSMATSLECRVPLLDQKLVELAAHMPSHMKVRGRVLKYVLKEALSDLLPQDILHRKKRGFGAPMGAWIKQELLPLLTSVLSRESIENRGLLDWATVEETIGLHLARKEDHTDHLLALLNLEIWCRIYLDGEDPVNLGEQFASEVVR
jgi:asparagine synthase (glutamine-hydrolysing)